MGSIVEGKMNSEGWRQAPVWLMIFGGIACLATGYLSWRYWHFATAGTLGRGFIERAFTEQRRTRRGVVTDYYADVRYRPEGGEPRLVSRVGTGSASFRQGFNYDIRYFPAAPDDIEFVENLEKRFPVQVVSAILSFTALVVGAIWWQGTRPRPVTTDWTAHALPPPGDVKPEYWEPPR